MSRRSTGSNSARNLGRYKISRARKYLGGSPDLIQPTGSGVSSQQAEILKLEQSLNSKVESLKAYAEEHGYEPEDLSSVDFEKMTPFTGDVSQELIEQLAEDDVDCFKS